MNLNLKFGEVVGREGCGLGFKEKGEEGVDVGHRTDSRRHSLESKSGISG